MSENKNDIFERATKQHVRLKVAIGVITAEDLWSMTLHGLNELAKDLNKQLQDKEVSFIGDKTEADTLLQLQFDLVKRVIDVKLEERDAAKLVAEKKERRKVLLEALADREEEALKSKSKEDILKELEELNAK